MKLNDTHRVACFGESLWVALAEGAEAGGSPVTVARNLKRLGVEPALITRVGIDDEGRRLIGLIENEIISTDYFQLDYEVPTGLAFTSPANLRQNGKLEAWDNISWDDSFEELVTETKFFAHTSLPTRNEVSRKTLFTFFDMRPHRVFCMNLRMPFHNREMIEYCMKGAYMLIISQAELELITGWFAPMCSVVERVQVLQDKFDIPYIIVSIQSNGCFLNARGIVYQHEGFSGENINSFGAENAFTAGLLQQFCAGSTPEATIEYACALQTLVASTQGACPVYDSNRVNQIIHQ